MSLYKDYYNDYMYERNNPIGNPARKVWVTKNGLEIKVSEMSSNHIRNCLRFIKNDLINEPWVEIFNEELGRRNYN